jgi:hypothetical protein
MSIAAWPVTHRSQLVHAYKPGERSSSEARFRTLRKHAWATSGVRITPRSGNRLTGQLTMFSSLNRESARLARHGDTKAAVRVAAAATALEARPEFTLLSELLTEMPVAVAKAVIDGLVPDDAPAPLMTALRNVARLTEQIRERELSSAQLAEVSAGWVKEVHTSYVLLVLMTGPETVVPRWMAGAANRARVGSFLVVVTDKLDGASAVFEALPALDVTDETQPAAFTPFGRGDQRALAITADDERMLSGEPQPLRVLVPVTVES